MIKLIAVLNGGAVDLRGGAARVNERGGIAGDTVARLRNLQRRLAGRRPLASRSEQPDFEVDIFERLLHGAADRRGHAARVPIESKDATECLKPERIGK